MSTPTITLKSQNEWLADGVQTVWNFSFAGGYLSKDTVRVYKKTPEGLRTEIIITESDFTGPFQLLITPAIPVDWKLGIYRDTSNEGVPLVNFADGAGFQESSMDTVASQSVFVAIEAADRAALSEAVSETVLETAALALVTANTANANATTAVGTANSALAAAAAAEATAVALTAAVDDAVDTATQAAADASAASAIAVAAAADVAELAEDLENIYTTDGGPINGNVSITGQLAITSAPANTAAIAIGSGANGSIQINDGTVQSFMQARSADLETAIGSLTSHGAAIWTNSLPRVRVNNAGSVAIAAPSSGTALAVNGNNEIQRWVSTTVRGGGNCYGQFYDPSGTKGFFGYGGSDDDMQFANLLNAGLEFYTNAIMRLSISAGGNVTVAAPASGVALFVNRTTAGSVTGGPLQFPNNSIVSWLDAAAGTTNCGFLWLDSGNTFHIGAGNTSRVQVSSAGNVVIPAPTSGRALVVGAISGAAAFALNSNAAQPSYQAFAVNNTDKGFIGASGVANGLINDSGANDIIVRVEAGDFRVSTSAGVSTQFRVAASGQIFGLAGIEMGFRGMPVASVTTGAFVATDNGATVRATAGVTIPNSVMSSTDVVSILNTTGSAITITKSITTAYNTATGSALGATFTLAARGRCVVEFTSGTECYVSGNIS